MRWFLRSVITATGLGTIGAFALAQPTPADPVPASSAPTIPIPAAPLLPAPVAELKPSPLMPAVPAELKPLEPLPAPAPLPLPPAPPLLPQPPEPEIVILPDIPELPELPAIPVAPESPLTAASLSGASRSVSESLMSTSAPCPGGRCALPGELADRLGSLPAALGAPAPPPASLCDAVCEPGLRGLRSRRVSVRGWLNGGYVYNTSVPDSKFNGPYNSIDRSAEPMFNQGYLIAERALPTSGAIGLGGRVDALFGYDHFLGQSRGFEVDRDFGQRWNGQYYGLAIPQAYVEAGNDVLSLKLGHFYTTVGYEMLPAPANFFYSRAYSYQFGQPINHWGGLVTARLTENWQAHAGLVNGWNTLVGRVNDVNFLGGLKYVPNGERWWTSFSIVTGEQQNNLGGLPGVAFNPGNRTRYSFLVGLTPGGPCGRWEYVFHNYYGWQEHGTPQDNFARWYGIDQYLYYRMSERVKLGGRFEWFRDEDGTRVGLNRVSNPNNPPLPGNYFSLTGGINYAPVPNFLVRPEIRWDFTSDTARRAFNDGAKNNQLLLAFDLIWLF